MSLLAGCDNNEQAPPQIQNSIYNLPSQLKARWEDHTQWAPYDAIAFFHGNMYSYRYISDNEKPVDTATFLLEQQVQKGAGYYDSSIQYEDRSLAFYPFSESNGGDGDNVIFTLPDIQQGGEGTFAYRFLPALARQKYALGSDELVFKNVCGGIWFSVTQEGITSVVFRSLDARPVSGRVKASMGDSQLPAIDDIIEGVDSVKIFAPESFIPGEHYLAVFLPQIHTNGLSCKLSKGDRSVTYCINKTIEVKRAQFTKLDELDKGLSFEDSPIPPENPQNPDPQNPPDTPDIPSNPEEFIQFADSKIKACLVAAFDSNGDGELSYAEAAAVTSLEGVFGQEKTFTSFNEFVYFTSVTETPAEMCKDWTMLLSIRFPSSLRRISEKSFQGCYRLTSIEFPNGLTGIGSSAFYGCKFLKSIVFPEGLTIIDSYAFYTCESLTSLDFPKGLTNIATSAFYACKGLTAVEFNAELEEIGSYAFALCKGLTSVRIPFGVTNLELNAFYGTSITSVELGKCIETGGPTTTSALRSEDDAGYIESRFGATTTSSIERIIILNGVKAIPSYTFLRCTGLKTISLPSSVTAINHYAFCGCTALESLDLPDNLTTLATHAFDLCSNLSSIEIPSGVKEICNYAFSNCSNLKEIRLPNGLQGIGHYAFYACQSLCSVEFPSTLESLGDWAFGYCRSLTSIIISRNITNWGRSSFRYCNKLTSVVIQDGITSIPHEAFQECSSLSYIHFPDSITSIGAYTFSGCSSLKHILLPSGLTNLGLYSFQNCNSLDYVVFNSEMPPQGAPWHYGQLYGNDRFEGTTCPIYVPDESLMWYQTDIDLYKYVDRIYPLSAFNF